MKRPEIDVNVSNPVSLLYTTSGALGVASRQGYTKVVEAMLAHLPDTKTFLLEHLNSAIGHAEFNKHVEIVTAIKAYKTKHYPDEK